MTLWMKLGLGCGGLMVAAVVGLVVVAAVVGPPPSQGAVEAPEPAAAAAIAPAPTPPPSTPPARAALGISMDGFLALQPGMSYRQVVEILGEEGEEMSRVELSEYTTVMYQWRKKGLFQLGNMNAMFQNGRLIQKAQFGLK